MSEVTPLPKRYLTESQVAEMMGCSLRAFRQRPATSRPPCIRLSPKKKLYDPDEVMDWIASLPRER